MVVNMPLIFLEVCFLFPASDEKDVFESDLKTDILLYFSRPPPPSSPPKKGTVLKTVAIERVQSAKTYSYS